MNEYTIPDPENGGYYKIASASDFEYLNPISYYETTTIRYESSILKDLMLSKLPEFALEEEMLDKIVHKKAVESWEEKYKEILATDVPVQLIGLLTSQKKSEQVKLLKGLGITPMQLTAFIFKAWTDFGFSLSQYKGSHYNKGLNKSDLPTVVEVTPEKVRKVGATPLSDGQLKQVVQHRKVTIAKFLDKKSEWHCFFITFKSLRGEETWKEGQAHLHYISDKFGISREQAVDSLKSDEYKLGNLPHIDLLEYGNQTTI